MERPEEYSSAKDLFNICLRNGMGKDFNSDLAEQHFRMIMDMLEPDEKILMPFIGIRNYRSLIRHEGNFAFALTQCRLLMVQLLAMADRQDILPLTGIRSVTIRKTWVLGIVTVESESLSFNIALDKTSAFRVYDALTERTAGSD